MLLETDLPEVTECILEVAGVLEECDFLEAV
jgi:hypothetical protein